MFARKNSTIYPTTRLRCRASRVLRPKPAAGGFRFSTLHARAALRSATFRYIPFIFSLQPRLPTQECFHSFHYAYANPPFHSAPLWLSNSHSGTQSQSGKLHSTPSQFAPLHSVITLAFPNPDICMPCGRVCPG